VGRRHLLGLGSLGPLGRLECSSVHSEKMRPRRLGRGEPPLPQDAGPNGVVDVVEPRLDVQELGRDLQTGSLQSLHVVIEG